MMIAVSGCEVSEVDTDFGAQVEGNYTMTFIETRGSLIEDPSENNKIIVTRLKDKRVEIVLTFTDPDQDDIEADDVTVSKSGDQYEFSKTFSNAELTGEVDGDLIEVYIDYEEGDNEKDKFLDVRGEK